MWRKALAVLKGCAVVVWAVFALVVTHDISPSVQEDTRVVWICEWDGDARCGGPGSYDIIAPLNLLRW